MAFRATPLSATVTADVLPFERGLDRAAARARRFGQEVRQASGGGAGGLQDLTRATTGLESGFRALGSVVALAGISQVGIDAVRAASELQKTEATVRALAGSTQKYAQLLSLARQGQQLYGGSLADNIRGLGQLVNTANRSGVELSKLDNIMRRLATVDPLQGVEGAAYAIKEALSNQGATATLSLRNRFELDRSVLKTIEDASATAAEKIDALDKALNQLGITNEVLTNAAQTDAAAMDRLAAAFSNAQAAGGSLLLQTMRPLAEQGAQLLNAVASGLNSLATVGDKLGTLQGQLVAGSESYEEYHQKATEAGQALLSTGVIFAQLTEEQYTYVQSLIAAGAAADEAVAKAEGMATAISVVGAAQRVLAEDTNLGAAAIADIGQRLLALASQGGATEATVIALANALRANKTDAEGLVTGLEQLEQASLQQANAAALATQREGERSAGLQASTAATSASAQALQEELLKKAESALEAQRLGAAQQFLANLGSQVAQGLMTSGTAATQLAAMYGLAADEAARLINLQAQLAQAKLNEQALADQRAGERGGGLTQAEVERQRANFALRPLRDQYARDAARTGRARISEEEKIQDKLADIAADGAQRLLEIDQRLAEERAEAHRRLAATILTTSADMVARQEANDLEMAGMSREQLERIQARERAEDEARARQAEYVRQARETAAQGDAELAQEQLDIQTQYNEERARLDQEYYERQRELAEDPEALAVLDQQYQEALAALQEATNIRLELAAAQREQVIAQQQAERDAVVAAAQDQANKVKGATEEQRKAVVAAVDEQAQAASRFASAWEGAASRVAAAANRAAGAISSIPTASGGGTSSGGGGGGETAAAGGGTFLTHGPTNLVVGDNPGGVELVTVTPLSGKGTTRVGGQMIRLAGGGTILASSRSTNPALNLPPVDEMTRRAARAMADGFRDLGQALESFERQYLYQREQVSRRIFFQEVELEVNLNRARRQINRAFKEQEAALDRAQEARERELLRQARERAEAASNAQVLAAESRLTEERNRRLAEVESRYQAQARSIVAAGAQARNDVESFWRTVQIADANAAFQEERQVILDEYERRAEEERERIREAAEDTTSELEDSVRAQVEQEFQARRDALEDAQLRDRLIYQQYWRQAEDETRAHLNRDLELLDAYWQQRFALIPGGEEHFENIERRATGGPVLPGRTYLVGENGPEYLTMGNASGRIIPGAGAGGEVLHLTVNIGPGNNVTEAQVKRAVQQALEERERRANARLRTGGIRA